MIDVDTLESLGTPVDKANSMYMDIEEFVRNSPESVIIGEFRKRAHGIVRRVTNEDRRNFDLPENTVAVLWWIGNDSSENELSAIDEKTWKTLTRNSTEATVERIITHYVANPNDDGHPAYALYEQHLSAPAGLGRTPWPEVPI